MKNMTRIVGILLLALAGVAGALVEFGHAPTTDMGEAGGNTPTAVTPYTRDEFERIVNEYVTIVNEQDPRVALALVEERIKTDERLLFSCHALVHEIGHAAYEKYADFDEALRYSNETCNTGYMHGVIEEYFSTIPNVLDNLENVCDSYDRGRCHHGAGHGLMFYTANDLPESLRLCDTFDGADARSFCAEGVFMENFNTNQKLHPSVYLDATNPFYPCAEQEDRHKAVCYFYAPTYFLTLHDFDYVAALAWCGEAEDAYVYSCVRGVGSLAIKFNIAEPLLVQAICNQAGEGKVAQCIDGMVGLYVNHYDSLEKGYALCEMLNAVNRETCLDSVAVRAYLFQD